MSKSIINELVLWMPDDTTVTVALHTRVTPYLYSKIAAIESEAGQKQFDLLRSNKTLALIEMETDVETKKKLLIDNYDEYMKVAATAESEDKKRHFETTMKVARAIIDTRSLPDELRLLIETEIDSEFWQSQDYSQLMVAADSFRRRYRS